jgi:ubiquinone/menaquinone biosynthesis C-methylase UbiE
MKVRDSGMPERDAWESFFDPDQMLTHLGLTANCHDVVEFGCGYGTFTLPAARRVGGTVFALDIDSTLLATAEGRAAAQGLTNIRFLQRDFIAQGTGLPDGSMDYAMVFNILHCEDPVGLLREAHRNLREGGALGVIHWKPDPDTPRGPPMSIRPRPEQCKQWAEAAGFSQSGGLIELPPYHFGLVLLRRKP